MAAQRFEQGIGSRVIAKSPAHMRIAVHVSRTEDETPAKLKWVLSQVVLAMAVRPGTVTRLFVFCPEHVQQVGVAKSRGPVSETLLVYQKGEGDAGVVAKLLRVDPVTEAHGREVRALVPKSWLVCAQLRDVLAAEDSSVVAQEDQHGRLAPPE